MPLNSGRESGFGRRDSDDAHYLEGSCASLCDFSPSSPGHYCQLSKRGCDRDVPRCML